eukprot:sb/3462677/
MARLHCVQNVMYYISAFQMKKTNNTAGPRFRGPRFSGHPDLVDKSLSPEGVPKSGSDCSRHTFLYILHVAHKQCQTIQCLPCLSLLLYSFVTSGEATMFLLLLLLCHVMTIYGQHVIPEHLPASWDYRTHGPVHPSIHQAGCPSCSWVAGTIVLEARMARVSEVYRPYSIQGLMNCLERVCIGGTTYTAWAHVRRNMYMAHRDHQPYVKKDCGGVCLCGSVNDTHPNMMKDQFAFVGPSVIPETFEEKLEALLEGPLAATIYRGRHAVTILGWTDKGAWISQESLGPNFGRFKDGTERIRFNSTNGLAIAKNSRYPAVFYDYNRANAFFKTERSKVRTIMGDEGESSVGLAKNRCARMGVKCRGVVTEGNTTRLVEDFAASRLSDDRLMRRYDDESGTAEPVSTESDDREVEEETVIRNPFSSDVYSLQRKTQLVFYLKHDYSGRWIGIKFRNGIPFNTKTVRDKINAAPFFFSEGRFIFYHYPDYQLYHNLLVPLSHTTTGEEVWELRECNLHSPHSGKSWVELTDSKPRGILSSAPTNTSDPKQMFDIKLNGAWQLYKSGSDDPQPVAYDNRHSRFIITEISNTRYLEGILRWNARQLVFVTTGQVIDSEFGLSEDMFSFGVKEREIVPRKQFFLYKYIGVQSDPDLVTPDLVAPRFSDRINFPRYKKLTVFDPDLVATPI